MISDFSVPYIAAQKQNVICECTVQLNGLIDFFILYVPVNNFSSREPKA